MGKVLCFKKDAWVATEISKLKEGDMVAHGGQTLIVTAPVYYKDNKPHLPADLYEPGSMKIEFGKDGLDYVYKVMDYLCLSRQDFEDGTSIIAEFEDGNTCIYSPRLSAAALNEFCKMHIDKYMAFYEKNKHKINAGESVPMDRFW